MLHKLRVTQIANATALAATTSYSFTSDHHKVASVQAAWTVTAASATATLQYSLDGTNWEDFTTATTVNATGSKAWGTSGTTVDALYWRVKYTHTSGASDTFKVYVSYVPRT